MRSGREAGEQEGENREGADGEGVLGSESSEDRGGCGQESGAFDKREGGAH